MMPLLPVALRRSLGWGVLAIGLTVLAMQIASVIRTKSALPKIRHPIYWSKSIYAQAKLNRNPAIVSEISAFYLIDRVLEHPTVRVGPALREYMWELDHISRVDVLESPAIANVPLSRWKDLPRKAQYSAVLGKRKVYMLVGGPEVTSYVFVATTEPDAPLFLVPEAEYRWRVAFKSGANFSTP